MGTVFSCPPCGRRKTEGIAAKMFWLMSFDYVLEAGEDRGLTPLNTLQML